MTRRLNLACCVHGCGTDALLSTGVALLASSSTGLRPRLSLHNSMVSLRVHQRHKVLSTQLHSIKTTVQLTQPTCSTLSSQHTLVMTDFRSCMFCVFNTRNTLASSCKRYALQPPYIKKTRKASELEGTFLHLNRKVQNDSLDQAFLRGHPNMGILSSSVSTLDSAQEEENRAEPREGSHTRTSDHLNLELW
eukprot:251190-Pelagomonas_calceolata.AAC.1